MEWIKIKQLIIDDLNSREIKSPSRRIRELHNIEKLMITYYPSYIKNPNVLKTIGKDEFKRQICDKKGMALNGAEKSIINEIYYRL
jgi:hypothetical protein